MTMLIDWPAGLRCAYFAVTNPHDAARAVRSAIHDGPCFQNRAFPLSPVPVLLRSDRIEPIRPLLESYVDILGKVVGLYRSELNVRRWYGLDAAAEKLMAAQDGVPHGPTVCRLDGYLELGSEQVKVLENNADAPAGTLFTARVNVAVRRIIEDVMGEHRALAPLTYVEPNLFLAALLDAAKAVAVADPGKCADPSHIAILQPAGSPNRESVEMVAEFLVAGFDAYLADPRDVEISGGRATFRGRPADLCWNKLNTVTWRGCTADEDFVLRWVKVMRETSMVHINSFGARYIAESKLTLAFLQEPRFARLFTESEREVVRTLLPWSRKLSADSVGDDGGPLIEHLLQNPRDYVIKEPYDIRGNGVTIGHDVTRARWHAAVIEGVRHGHVAQRRVVPTHYPVVEAGSAQVHPMAISVDTYLFGGQVVGFGSKASHNAKINIFQGGQKLAVHVVAESGAVSELASEQSRTVPRGAGTTNASEEHQ